jgi:tetratricopeptide (TPR) repeat protein
MNTMKKNRLYAALLLVFISAAGFVVLKFGGEEKEKQSAVYTLLERKGTPVQTGEWKNVDAAVKKLQRALLANPADVKAMIKLANLFIMESRATGNHAYYDKAALKYVNEALLRDKNNFDALTLQSLIYLSQHHFAEALEIARVAQKINPYNAFLHGVLVDGYVEMGHYDSAVMSAEKMMSIRPDLRSYSRVSYLREIHGDSPGAIEVMQLAIDAGLPGDEATEWSRVQLGLLFEQVGDLEKAAACYENALTLRPAYAHALAGMARLALVKKDFEKATAYYLAADSLVGDFTFKEELIDVYQQAGKKEQAATLSALVINDMEKNARAASRDETIGHYSDRELALAYLKTGNYRQGLKHALAEYNRRPKNIEVNETLAWAYHVTGEKPKALEHIKIALKTKSVNPALLCRAGLISLAIGDTVQAKSYLQDALKNNPGIAADLKASAALGLKQIQS